MTKGKLYSEVYNKSSRMQDKSYECYDAVGLDAVNDLLAEAQKDFPFNYAMNDNPYRPNFVDTDTLKKWYLKWFGDT